MENYRVVEIKFDDGKILFFAEHLESGIFKDKWKRIGNTDGYYKKETAEIDVKNHYRFYNPPTVAETKIHEIK